MATSYDGGRAFISLVLWEEIISCTPFSKGNKITQEFSKVSSLSQLHPTPYPLPPNPQPLPPTPTNNTPHKKELLVPPITTTTITTNVVTSTFSCSCNSFKLFLKKLWNFLEFLIYLKMLKFKEVINEGIL
jgi:hypothetical protein